MRHSLKSPALLPLAMLGVNPYIAITANIKLHEYGDKACTVILLALKEIKFPRTLMYA